MATTKTKTINGTLTTVTRTYQFLVNTPKDGFKSESAMGRVLFYRESASAIDKDTPKNRTKPMQTKFLTKAVLSEQAKNPDGTDSKLTVADLVGLVSGTLDGWDVLP